MLGTFSPKSLQLKQFYHYEITLNKHLYVMSDTNIAVAYRNEQKGTKSETCNNITKKIWYKFMDRECKFQKHIYQGFTIP